MIVTNQTNPNTYRPRSFGSPKTPNALGSAGFGVCSWKDWTDDFSNDQDRFDWAVKTYQQKFGQPLSTRVWAIIKAKGFNCKDSAQGLVDGNPPQLGDRPAANTSDTSTAPPGALPQVSSSSGGLLSGLPPWALPAAAVAVIAFFFLGGKKKTAGAQPEKTA